LNRVEAIMSDLIPTSKRQELEVSLTDYGDRRLVRLRLYRDRGNGYEPSRSVAFPIEKLADVIRALEAAKGSILQE
jgi:hypothetical protein